MEVELLNHTPLWVASTAIRTCWDSGDKSDTGWFIPESEGDPDAYYVMGEKDLALIDRVGNKNKHSSTLEHITYNFYVSGISRAVLQELARHRIASLSVKSTRYTLKELKNEEYMTEYMDKDAVEFASKYLVWTGNNHVDHFSYKALWHLQAALKKGIANDKAKYCLPEAYKTELTWSINMRSLQNFLSLRTNKAALWEIRDLAHAVFEALPEDHKYLLEGHVEDKI